MLGTIHRKLLGMIMAGVGRALGARRPRPRLVPIRVSAARRG